MNPANSLVHAYFKAFPESRAVVYGTLQGTFTSGDDLVDKNLKPMIDWVYGKIADMVAPKELTAAQALMYIEELSVFARYNAQFLKQAAASVEGFCFELAQELRRNHLEEGGDRGKIPAHYVLYTNALLSDLGVLVNGHVPAPETHVLLTLHDLMVTSHAPSIICGGYYATEGVAIAETEILRDITDRYGELTSEATGSGLKNLDFYYRLHLDDDHVAAGVDGLSVEAAHIEGIAQFIRNSETFGINLPQALDGFLQIMEGMTHWWTQLAVRSREMINEHNPQ